MTCLTCYCHLCALRHFSCADQPRTMWDSQRLNMQRKGSNRLDRDNLRSSIRLRGRRMQSEVPAKNYWDYIFHKFWDSNSQLFISNFQFLFISQTRLNNKPAKTAQSPKLAQSFWLGLSRTWTSSMSSDSLQRISLTTKILHHSILSFIKSHRKSRRIKGKPGSCPQWSSGPAWRVRTWTSKSGTNIVSQFGTPRCSSPPTVRRWRSRASTRSPNKSAASAPCHLVGLWWSGGPSKTAGYWCQMHWKER